MNLIYKVGTIFYKKEILQTNKVDGMVNSNITINIQTTAKSNFKTERITIKMEISRYKNNF